MAQTSTNSSEEIIEKKASSPIATSCLIIACLALFGAILFQLVEIGQYRSGSVPTNVKKGPGQDQAAKFTKTMKDAVSSIISKSTAAKAAEEDAGGEAAPESAKTPTAEEKPAGGADAGEAKAGAPEKAAGPDAGEDAGGDAGAAPEKDASAASEEPSSDTSAAPEKEAAAGAKKAPNTDKK